MLSEQGCCPDILCISGLRACCLPALFALTQPALTPRAASPATALGEAQLRLRAGRLQDGRSLALLSKAALPRGLISSTLCYSLGTEPCSALCSLDFNCQVG